MMFAIMFVLGIFFSLLILLTGVLIDDSQREWTGFANWRLERAIKRAKRRKELECEAKEAGL